MSPPVHPTTNIQPESVAIANSAAMPPSKERKEIPSLDEYMQSSKGRRVLNAYQDCTQTNPAYTPFVVEDIRNYVPWAARNRVKVAHLRYPQKGAMLVPVSQAAVRSLPLTSSTSNGRVVQEYLEGDLGKETRINQFKEEDLSASATANENNNSALTKPCISVAAQVPLANPAFSSE